MLKQINTSALIFFKNRLANMAYNHYSKSTTILKLGLYAKTIYKIIYKNKLQPIIIHIHSF